MKNTSERSKVKPWQRITAIIIFGVLLFVTIVAAVVGMV